LLTLGGNERGLGILVYFSFPPFQPKSLPERGVPAGIEMLNANRRFFLAGILSLFDAFFNPHKK
jgi:hypothetical protein